MGTLRDTGAVPTLARTMDAMDDPIWAALTSADRDLVRGGPLARRFVPEVSPFAAVADRSTEAFEALASLLAPGDGVAMFTPDPLDAPAGLVIDMQASLLQMVLTAPVATASRVPDYVVLGSPDVPDMLDLAERTRPGPFGPRTIEFGLYVGLRVGSVLAAMAGERMRFDRFVEISAVCVDPAHRGRGLAALLTSPLARRIQERGSTPFLHVFTSNAGAIALYGKLGFTVRRSLHVTRLRRPPIPSGGPSPVPAGATSGEADH